MYDTGGLHDTVRPLSVETDSGNGFVFKNFDAAGLFWAIDRAVEFYRLPDKKKHRQLPRIMKEATAEFCHENMVNSYVNLYERALRRPIFN